MIEFFILPTYSYFGDYQILYGLRSQISYKAGDSNQNRLCITLNLNKDVLLQMMDDYPEARKFYMERSWERRIEFRRRMRKFYEQFEKEKIYDKFHNVPSTDEESSIIKDDDENSENKGSNEDEDSDASDKEDSDCEDTVLDDEMILDKRLNKKSSKINRAINKKISKFYPINIEDELVETEQPFEVLQRVSDDEWPIDNSHLIDEDNRKVSFDSI